MVESIRQELVDAALVNIDDPSDPLALNHQTLFRRNFTQCPVVDESLDSVAPFLGYRLFLDGLPDNDALEVVCNVSRIRTPGLDERPHQHRHQEAVKNKQE